MSGQIGQVGGDLTLTVRFKVVVKQGADLSAHSLQTFFEKVQTHISGLLFKHTDCGGAGGERLEVRALCDSQGCTVFPL